MCFYQRESLPGYSAIFRHPNDELNFCYYLIPCGKDGMCGDVSVAPFSSLQDPMSYTDCHCRDRGGASVESLCVMSMSALQRAWSVYACSRQITHAPCLLLMTDMCGCRRPI